VGLPVLRWEPAPSMGRRLLLVTKKIIAGVLLDCDVIRIACAESRLHNWMGI
jgi:hypothetical protein